MAIRSRPYGTKNLLSAPDTKTERRRVDGDVGNVLQSIGEFDLHEDLKSLRIPTLILHGDADPLHYRSAERMHASIAGSKLEILEGVGHWAFVDGTEGFSRSILEFLAGLAED